MIKRMFLVIFIVFSCYGCVIQKNQTRGSYMYFDRHSDKVGSNKNADSIKIFYKEKPENKFIELGLVEAIVNGRNVSLKDVFPELQKQAALMDADGVYKIELQRYSYQGEAMHVTAVAIKIEK